MQRESRVLNSEEVSLMFASHVSRETTENLNMNGCGDDNSELRQKKPQNRVDQDQKKETKRKEKRNENH